METQELGDKDLAANDLGDDGCLTAYRARLRGMLDEIATQAKAALSEGGIDLDLFFLVPNSGDAVLSFGTPADPSDDEWKRAGAIVSSIVQEFTGLERTRLCPVHCTSTNSLADHQPPQGLASHSRLSAPASHDAGVSR